MTCKTCGKPKCACGKDGCSTGAAVVIKNPTEYVNFRKVVIPASAGDEATNPPTPGKYCNVVLFYEATESVYIYSSDGVPTLVSDKSDIAAIKKAIADETKAREDADQEIWTEIEAIEAASDVVDVVGTYAELQAYDTSKLHNNDLIKVLQDETHDDAIAYYRWIKPNSQFTFVGVEGPYYTETQIDTMMGDKQDKLTAGENIQISGATISATDTTYSDFTGTDGLEDGVHGLVPAPTTTDTGKYLKADGTWGTISQYTPTVFYIDKSLPRYGGTPSYVSSVHVYKDSALTETASLQELYDAIDAGGATLVYSSSMSMAQAHISLYAFHSPHDGNPDSGGDYIYFAGDDGTVLDATPLGQSTNYPAILDVSIRGLYAVGVMRGATSGQAGYMGIVPTPASADRDKFLRGDGTWADVSGATIFYLGSDLAKTDSSTSKNIYKNSGLTTSATATDLINAFLAGPVILRYTVGSNAVNEYLVARMVQKASSMADFYITRAERTYDSGTQAYVNEIGEFLLSTNGSTKTSSYFSAVTTVDTALSLQSNNPVANSTLTATIGDIETILQTLNSGNGVA